MLVDPLCTLLCLCCRGEVGNVEGVYLKGLEAQEQGCSAFVLPEGNQNDDGMDQLTIIKTPVSNLYALLKEGFHEAPTGLKDGQLPEDPEVLIGRARSFDLVYEETNFFPPKTTRGLHGFRSIDMPVDCAIYPGVGDFTVTGNVST